MFDRLVRHDVEPLEHGLVHHAPLGGLAAEVDAVPVRGQAERLVEVLLDGVEVQVDGGQSLASVGHCSTDTRLLGLQHLYVDGIGVEGVEQLLLLGFELLHAPRDGDLLALGGSAGGGELVEHHGSHLGNQRLEGLDLQVVLLDECFHDVDGDGPPAAVGALLLATQADEVRVDATASTLRMVHDES